MMLSNYEIACIKTFYNAKDEKTARKARGKFWRYQKVKEKLGTQIRRGHE